MDDEIPSKMTHNELVDLHMQLRVLKRRISSLDYELELVRDQAQIIVNNIDNKIIDNLAERE